jgi:bacterioferritin (cytochrome b1)
MKRLANHDRSQTIRLLEARLASERAGVKLYERVLGAMRASGDAQVRTLLEEMEADRDLEAEHVAWLEEQLRALHGGAAAGGAGDAAARHVEQVAQGDAELPQLVNALLAAKLADDAGWDGLVQLAHEAGDREARRELRRRLHEEEDLLLVIRQLMEKLVFTEVLAEDAASAPGPAH